jgi:hypothetical protein
MPRALVARSMASPLMCCGLVAMPVWSLRSVVVTGALIFILQFVFGGGERADDVIQQGSK